MPWGGRCHEGGAAQEAIGRTDRTSKSRAYCEVSAALRLIRESVTTRYSADADPRGFRGRETLFDEHVRE